MFEREYLPSIRVLVLRAGEVVEFDAPSILLTDEESVFYGMVKDAGLLEEDL